MSKGASIGSMQRLRGLGRGPIIGAGAILVAVIAGVVALAVVGREPVPTPSPSPSSPALPTERPTASPKPDPTPEPTEAPPAARCPLSGLGVADPLLIDRVTLAVSIDNHPGARPARNLTRSDLVVEAPVEGDTTRFTAFYLCQQTDGLTGPVRSGRYYHIDLWQDLHVLPVFFGASWETLARLDGAGLPYVNGITGAWPWFGRAGTYVAPHNLYADLEAIRRAAGQNARLDALAGRAGAIRPPFTFDPAVVLPIGRRVSALEIRTSSYWRFGWTWDAALDAWRRSDGGRPVTDELSGDPVTASHVVVQRVVQETIYDDPDPGGNPRRYQHLVGSGAGTLYSGGRAIAVRWSRPTAADATHWTYEASGDPVVLPPGLIWWEIVPIAAGLTET